MPPSAPLRVVSLVVLVLACAGADDARRIQSFETDPGWEGYRNRLAPEPAPIVRQHFGYRPTNNAGGKTAGEIGGWVQRSIVPAYYAMPITSKTLADKLSFSGRFAVHRDAGSSGTLLGFFNAKDSRGWRTPHSLALRIDGNGSKYWVFFEYGTKNWHAGCKGCFEGPAYQKTPTKPFAADGTPHDFSLTYDPAGGGGNGLITFVLDGQRYELTPDPGHKLDGATFDRFGVWNQQITGDGSELYFDDLVVNGEPISFDNDPKWEAKGNDTEYENRAIRPFHDFGFSPTRHAGGAGAKGGEIGGLLWRDERPAYYGRKAGPFTLKDRFGAAGTLAFTGAGSDSAVYFGWFDSKTKRENNEPEDTRPQRNLLGLLIEGPSRVGHYFRPAYRCGDGEGMAAESGPILRPDGQVHRWAVRYDPDAAGGDGRITATLDDRVQTMNLRPGDKARPATFDRFGFFNCQSGGHYVYLYIDDLVLE